MALAILAGLEGTGGDVLVPGLLPLLVLTVTLTGMNPELD